MKPSHWNIRVILHWELNLVNRMSNNSKFLRIILRELGQLTISFLIVATMVLVLGYYFEIWIDSPWEIGLMTLLFYTIIGFYRLLNYLARKSWDR